MLKILKNIWILTEDGATIFNSEEKALEDQFFGMFMSALNSYAKEIVKGGLLSFELSDMRFSFLKKDQFIFIANSSLKDKEKKALRELESIKNKFFQLCPKNLLDKWNGDISIFSGFKKEFEHLLK
ncbi:MAG: hypothetical protein ACFFAN_09195 [Promethearchaeota archaeon]